MGKNNKGPIATKEKAIERFRKRTEDYAYNSIKRCSLSAQKQIDKMMVQFPYNDYSDYINCICYRNRVYESNSYLWDECHSCSYIAYWYSIGRCAVSGYEDNHVRFYIMKLIKIYIMCKVAQYNLEKGHVSWDKIVEKEYKNNFND